MMCELSFIFEGATLRFRAIRRKGALRWIASDSHGSLGAITKFAPPSKPIPRVVIKLLALIDFRIPGCSKFVDSLNVSKALLTQVAALLQIPVERVGICVGEPNDQQKLVLSDVDGQSSCVLKIAAGKEAGHAIRRELQGAEAARQDVRWSGMVPEIRGADPVSGREAILIERIQGRQLSPSAFEQIFLQPSDLPLSEGISLDEWIAGQDYSKREELNKLLDICEQTGALSLRSPVGMVHGDFGPWNVIRRNADKGVRRKAFGIGNRKENPAPPALCAVDWEFYSKDTPLIFDHAYAAWCFSELLGHRVSSIDSNLWSQLVTLGALWKELRQQL